MQDSGFASPSRRQVLEVLAAFGVGTLSVSNTARADPGDRRWEFETGDSVWSSPTVIDGTVFIGSGDGNVYALSAQSGEEEWAFESPRHINSSPAVVDGKLFIGSSADSIYALDAETGEELWNFAFESGRPLRSSPTVVDGKVVVGYFDANVYALDSETGEEEWTFETGNAVYSSPTVDDGIVFIGSRDSNLYALNATTGEEQWVFETSGRIQSSATVANGTVFVGSYDNNLYAVDAASGEQQWVIETDGPVESSPTVLDGTVFVGSFDNNVYALDSGTGEQQWTFETNDIIFSSPTVAGETVFVGSNDTNLYALDRETGEQQWAFETGDGVGSSPTVVDGTVFVGSSDGNVYALDAGVDESSDDSRVQLGTLGHYSGEIESSSEDNTKDSGGGEDFQPGEHGFGFENWSGEQSWSVDGEDIQYEPDDVSEDEIQELVEDVWPSDHGEALIEPVVKYVYTRFNGGGLTNGHCYGMVHAAMEYFEDPSALPDDVDTASDIPYPVGEYEGVGHDIRFYRQSQFFDSESRSSALSVLQSGLFSVLWPGYADVNLRSETEELREAITQYGYAPISLADPANDEYHQVLGYEIETDEEQKVVYAYDPNAQAAVHEREREQFRLEVDDGQNPDMRYFDRDEETDYKQFVSMTNAQREADLQEVAAGAVITALIGAAESTKFYLQAPATLGKSYVRLLFAGLRSPAHLEVDGPDDTSVLHPDMAETDHPAGKYSDAVFIFGAPAEEYSYTIVGEEQGEYTLELRGASEDTEVVSEDVTGEITSGEHHTVSVTIPEEGEADVAVQTETESDESTVLDVETVAGGGAVTVGLLYLAYRMKQDETEPK